MAETPKPPVEGPGARSPEQDGDRDAARAAPGSADEGGGPDATVTASAQLPALDQSSLAALAPFSALGESKGGRCLLGPGWCDLEEFEDAALCVGEAVELDAGVCVGEAESLEDAEDVTSGGFR